VDCFEQSVDFSVENPENSFFQQAPWNTLC